MKDTIVSVLLAGLASVVVVGAANAQEADARLDKEIVAEQYLLAGNGLRGCCGMERFGIIRNWPVGEIYIDAEPRGRSRCRYGSSFSGHEWRFLWLQQRFSPYLAGAF